MRCGRLSANSRDWKGIEGEGRGGRREERERKREGEKIDGGRRMELE